MLPIVHVHCVATIPDKCICVLSVLHVYLGDSGPDRCAAGGGGCRYGSGEVATQRTKRGDKTNRRCILYEYVCWFDRAKCLIFLISLLDFEYQRSQCGQAGSDVEIIGIAV
jgi:hypothetical protein